MVKYCADGRQALRLLSPVSAPASRPTPPCRRRASRRRSGGEYLLVYVGYLWISSCCRVAHPVYIVYGTVHVEQYTRIIAGNTRLHRRCRSLIHTSPPPTPPTPSPPAASAHDYAFYSHRCAERMRVIVYAYTWPCICPVPRCISDAHLFVHTWV